MSCLQRDEILEILRAHKDDLVAQYGIVSLGIFGSVARDQAQPDSDVDVVVKLDDPDLFALVRLREDLMALLGCNVDMVHEHQWMRPSLRRRIEQDGVLV